VTDKKHSRAWWIFFGALAVSVMMGPGCSCGDDASDDGNQNRGGNGGAGASANGGDGGSLLTTGGAGATTTVDCDVPCVAGEVCSHGVCIPEVDCTVDDDCDNDTYCDPATDTCQPWQDAVPPHDDQCLQLIPPGIFAPSVKCEFAAAPAGDAFPNHVDVMGTPVVINFNNPSAAGPPSIVATFTATVVDSYTEDLGVIRVLSGADCSLETNLGGKDEDGDNVVDWVVSSSSLAVADLDGDDVAEIVAYGADGSLLAFEKKLGSWGLLWKADYNASFPWNPCAPNGVGLGRCSFGWAGVSIHDLDDDGVPEIVREGVVFSATGALLSGIPAGYVSYAQGLFPVVANLDQDPAIEITNGAFVWEWSGGAWVLEAGYLASSPGSGHVAVADFGEYGTGVPSENAEVAMVRSDNVYVFAITGELVFGPINMPGTGSGGPPTVSDFDGDGLAELAVAARDFYSIFDIDCGPNPRPGGTCNLGPCDAGVCPTGVLWSRETQDFSSSVTGSSVFDFEADDRAEVVYGDECFVRVYDGESGEVLFSQYRSSCTWYENPIIADVDGDFRAELVTPSNKACSITGDGKLCEKLNPDGVDAQFNGLRCEDGGDCVSGLCDEGLCRCTANAECCGAMNDAACLEEGFKCAAPNAGTLGTGNTCRAAHPHGVSGIRVYKDANDLWVRSRTIWNQHAYAVTHIEENGTVPQTSQWLNNWEQPELNNFRQNVPGTPNGNGIPDATAGPSENYSCGGGTVTMSVDICNRGAAPVGAGVTVGFYDGAQKVCETETTGPLLPEECETVQCDWGSPPTTPGNAVDVTVVANDGQAVTECKEGNNEGVVLGVFCEPAN